MKEQFKIERSPEFRKVEKEYENLLIFYEIDKESCFQYGEITDELDIAKVYKIKNLEFKDKNTGKTIDLKDLIPAGFELGIVSGGGAKLIREKNLITVPELGHKGNQFSLLHEIGHANQKREYETHFYKLQTEQGELDIVKSIPPGEFKKEIPYEEAADEFALNKLLKLRDQGIDLEPEMTESDLQNHIKNRRGRMQQIANLA